ncbi:MAG TPA: lysophospholipid acyltransferase family protein [Opitutaceae bacterium]|nr:lysophospholipid acyltransferase family protein [Opitutaceae bacterium]
MSVAFPQVEMSPIYGACHYAIRVGFDMLFRGEVAGVEHLPKSGAFLIAANHASHLDPPMVGCHVPRQMCFFARKTLWHGGMSSWWLDAVGCIPVDRDGGQDIGALKRVLRALADGKVMILFPEGTRSPDGRLQKPKPGVGFIVCKTRVPVVPARIFGSFDAFGKGAKLPHLGTPLTIAYGAPILPAEYDDPAAGKDRYQLASERIMARIERLQPPTVRVI